MKDALRESERKLNTLFNNLRGIAYRCKYDREWTIEFISAGFEEMTGYLCDDIVDNKRLSFNDIIVPEDRIRVYSEIKSALKREESFEINYRIKTASGEIRYVVEKGVGIFSEDKNEIVALEGFISDYTKQVLADEALKESEQRFKDFANLLPQIVYETDLEGKLTFINQQGLEKFGYSRKEFETGLNILRGVAPEDRERAKSILQKIGDDTITGNPEYMALRKDGSKFPMLVYSGVVKRNGVPMGLRGIIVDISERKTSENILKEKEQKLRLIINKSPVGVSTTDLEGHYIDVNPALCKIIGYPRDEMINKHFNQFAHPDDAEKNRKKFEDLIHGKINYFELEKRYIHKNGSIIYVLIRSQLIHDNLGNPLFQTAIIEDITERKRAELIQKVIYNISNAVLVTENLEILIGQIRGELGKIIDTTNFFVALYDTKTDTISLPYFADEYDHQTYMPKGKSLTQYVLDTQKPLLANIDTKRKLAEEGKLERFGTLSKIWLGVPLKVEGEVTGVLAVQSYKNADAFNEADMKMLEFVSGQISLSIHRKKTETELKTALEKATESDRLKSSFLATMSHELRTPLNAIIGFSEFLEKDLNPSDVERFGKIINSSGNHLLSIVNDLFDITLIETGETKIKKEPVPLKLIFHDVYNVISSKQTFTSNNIDLKLIVNDKILDQIIKTDANKLKQILINLLKNALKFTSEGFVHYGCEPVSENGSSFLQFFVKDTGIGIAKDKQELIFDIFRQAEDCNTRKYGGTGIGLSVAKRLAELLGGRIWVESEQNQGSSFYFTIPVEPTNDGGPNKSNNEEKLYTDSKELILIVEDDVTSFEYIKTVLKKSGFNYLWAKNGEEALAFCAENRNISLLLMDMNMPVMDGYEATKKIKKLNPSLPIIAQTAYAVAGDKEKIISTGCDDYIPKPIKTNELLSKIEQVLARSKEIGKSYPQFQV
jgi:PAS domain S-box-containing protein